MKPTYEELVKKYINLVYYYTKRWIYKKEDIDDIVQETYKKALMKYGNFIYQSDAQLKSWLLTICRNTIFDTNKQKKQTVTFDDDMEMTLADTKTESWLEKEIKREEAIALKNTLNKLNDNDHDVIRLRYFDDLSFKEIAPVLGISEATAKMRCYRTLEKLRKEMSK